MAYTGSASVRIVGSDPLPASLGGEPVDELSISYSLVVELGDGTVYRLQGTTSDVRHWPAGVQCYPPEYGPDLDVSYPARVSQGRLTVDIPAIPASIECSEIESRLADEREANTMLRRPER